MERGIAFELSQSIIEVQWSVAASRRGMASEGWIQRDATFERGEGSGSTFSLLLQGRSIAEHSL